MPQLGGRHAGVDRADQGGQLVDVQLAGPVLVKLPEQVEHPGLVRLFVSLKELEDVRCD